MKGRARSHRAHAEDVDLARLTIKHCLDLVPVHLRLAAKLVRLWHEDLVTQQPQRLLAQIYILAHCGLAYNDLRLLLPQPRPDAMGRMTLLARSVTISLQNRVDKRYRRGQPGTLPLRLLPIRRHRVGQSPAHLPSMNSQLPRHRADRSGTMFVLPPDLLV